MDYDARSFTTYLVFSFLFIKLHLLHYTFYFIIMLLQNIACTHIWYIQCKVNQLMNQIIMIWCVLTKRVLECPNCWIVWIWIFHFFHNSSKYGFPLMLLVFFFFLIQILFLIQWLNIEQSYWLKTVVSNS